MNQPFDLLATSPLTHSNFFALYHADSASKTRLGDQVVPQTDTNALACRTHIPRKVC